MSRAAVLLVMLLAGAAQAATPDPAALYRHNCFICHQAGGPGAVMLAKRLPKGVSPLLMERRDLQAAYVQAVARNGIGTMPRFTRIELTDGELAAVAGWLAAGPDVRR
jgi:mono/diheme cytochrome c family protein